MTSLAKSLLVAILVAPLAATAPRNEDAELIKRLSESKHSLVEGLKQAESVNSLAISAKFEIEDGKLSLSIYTAKAGRGKDAEENILQELSGEPTAAAWEPKTEVFQDKEHIARASMHLTLLQLSKMSLIQAIQKALAIQKGTAYSAIPAVQHGRPVVTVKIATQGGQVVTVTVDLQTGKVTK